MGVWPSQMVFGCFPFPHPGWPRPRYPHTPLMSPHLLLCFHPGVARTALSGASLYRSLLRRSLVLPNSLPLSAVGASEGPRGARGGDSAMTFVVQGSPGAV